MREGLADSRATGAALYLPYYLAMLAQACEITGRFEEGLTILTEAISVVERTEENIYKAKLYQLKGNSSSSLVLRACNPPFSSKRKCTCGTPSSLRDDKRPNRLN